MKVAILFDNFGPYHIARIGSAYYQLRSHKWEVIGIEIARSSSEYAWRSSIDQLPWKIYTVSDSFSDQRDSLNKIIRNLYTLLGRIKADVVVIAGYSRLSMLSALLWSVLNKKPAILMTESKEDDEIRIGWKEKIKSFFVRKYSSALVGGQPQQRYLIKLGFPKEAIFTGYNVVDNSVFHPDTIKSLPTPISSPYFLSINRFVSKKNLPLLINSYAQYRQQAGKNVWDLVLCGDGELRPQIEALIKQYQLENHVHLPGFLQQDELLPYFAHAKCFVHASTTEQWGLVVNEAMAAGLPILISNRCGCFEDLIIEGVNGFGFDPENQLQLTNLMLKMSSGEVDLETMGQAALTHIQKYSPDYFAQGLQQAIEYALKQRS